MIRLVDHYGAYLVGRGLGTLVHQLVMDELHEEVPVILDFSGVKMVTPSFADELVSKLLTQLGPNRLRRCVSVVNARPEIIAWIRYVLARQTTQEEGPSRQSSEVGPNIEGQPNNLADRSNFFFLDSLAFII